MSAITFFYLNIPESFCLFFCHMFFPEPPAEIVTCLHDLIVPEKGMAVFECEVSVPWTRAKWFKDGVPITVSDGYDIRVDGTHHLLYLPKISKEDIGRYTVKIDDKETTARLRVKGTIYNTTTMISNSYISSSFYFFVKIVFGFIFNCEC